MNEPMYTPAGQRSSIAGSRKRDSDTALYEMPESVRCLLGGEKSNSVSAQIEAHTRKIAAASALSRGRIARRSSAFDVPCHIGRTNQCNTASTTNANGSA